VMNASRGNIITAPDPVSMISPSRGEGVQVPHTDSEPVGSEGHGCHVIIMEAIRPCSQVDEVYEHKDEVEPVDETTAEDWRSMEGSLIMST
jgi:hypothetical protein